MRIINGYSVHSIDGNIGQVVGFYLDGLHWKVRYLVVDLSTWASQRKVLLSPVSLKSPQWEEKQFPVSITRKQVEESPDINTDKPFSKIEEERLNNHYDWPLYWKSRKPNLLFGGMSRRRIEPQHQSGYNQALWDFGAMMGFLIAARNDPAGSGELVDIIVEDRTWTLQHLVIDTGTLLPGRLVLLSTEHLRGVEIDWGSRQIRVKIPPDRIRNGLPFNSAMLGGSQAEQVDLVYYDKRSSNYREVPAPSARPAP
jgi:hypothetical protein